MTSFIDFYNEVEDILEGHGIKEMPSTQDVAMMQEQAMTPQEIAVYYMGQFDTN